VSNLEKYLQEKATREATVKEARGAELKRITEEHDARMKKEAAEQKRKDAAEQAKREAAFEAELEAETRRLYFAGSPGSPESLYQASREEFRKLVLRRRAEAAAIAPQHSLYRWER
jgi:hypothetical protein